MTIVLDCKPVSADQSPPASDAIPGVANTIVLTEPQRQLTLWTSYHDQINLAASRDGDYTLTLVYTPGSTGQFFGRPVSDLSDIQSLGVRFTNTLKAMNLQLGDKGIVGFTVTINGVNAIHADLGAVSPADDQTAYTSIDVHGYFGAIEQSYRDQGGQ